MTTPLKLSQRFLFVATIVACTFITNAQVSPAAKTAEHKENMVRLYFALVIFVCLIAILYFNFRGKGKENKKKAWLQFLRGRFRGY
jgi:hypothetical protein